MPTDRTSSERKFIMSKKFKKFAAGLMATASLATGMVGMSANASYYDDYFSNFVVSGYSTHYTSTREKEDDTSASIRIDSTNPSGCKLRVYVYGTYSNTSNGIDKTAGSPKIVGAASYYTYLPNYVWEDMKWDDNGHLHDNLYAFLGFRTSSTPNGQPEFYATGYWSPDSI